MQFPRRDIYGASALLMIYPLLPLGSKSPNFIGLLFPETHRWPTTFPYNENPGYSLAGAKARRTLPGSPPHLL